ncbi:MAG: hypothetical protein KDM63_14550 [Verrucomicrobiae bacterium]|nr:hypothetical protein [Verrucomicrobiae bacterium]
MTLHFAAVGPVVAVLLASCAQGRREADERIMAELEGRAKEAESARDQVLTEIKTKNAAVFDQVKAKHSGVPGKPIWDGVEIVSDRQDGAIYSGNVLVRIRNQDGSPGLIAADKATVTKGRIELDGFRKFENFGSAGAEIVTRSLDGTKATYAKSGRFELDGQGPYRNEIKLPMPGGQNADSR